MSIGEIVAAISTGALFLGTFIEVSKIKINPWSSLFGWIGNKMMAGVKEEMKEIRKEQEELAAASGMSPTHISNIETGSTNVSLNGLLSIANALSATMDDLLYDSVIHARPQMEREIQQVVDSCDDYELRMVKDVAQAVVDVLRANEKLRNG